MRIKSLEGFRKLLDKIPNVSYCQVRLYACADRRKQGFHLTCSETGQRAMQWGVNIILNHQHSKFLPWSAYEFEETDTQLIWLKCILLFYISSTFGPWIFHHGEVLVQPQKHETTGKSSYTPLGAQAGIDGIESRVCRYWFQLALQNPKETPPTPFRNKEALVISHNIYRVQHRGIKILNYRVTNNNQHPSPRILNPVI